MKSLIGRLGRNRTDRRLSAFLKSWRKKVISFLTFLALGSETLVRGCKSVHLGLVGLSYFRALGFVLGRYTGLLTLIFLILCDDRPADESYSDTEDY